MIELVYPIQVSEASRALQVHSWHASPAVLVKVVLSKAFGVEDMVTGGMSNDLLSILHPIQANQTLVHVGLQNLLLLAFIYFHCESKMLVQKIKIHVSQMSR